MYKEYNLVPNTNSNFNFEFSPISSSINLLLSGNYYPTYLFPMFRTTYKDYDFFCKLITRLPLENFICICRQKDSRDTYTAINNHSFITLLKLWVYCDINLKEIFQKQNKLELTCFTNLYEDEELNVKYNHIQLSKIRTFASPVETFMNIYSFYQNKVVLKEEIAAINLFGSDIKDAVYDFCNKYEQLNCNEVKTPNEYITISNSYLSPRYRLGFAEDGYFKIGIPNDGHIDELEYFEYREQLYNKMVKDLNLTSDEFIGILRKNNPEKNNMLLDTIKSCLANLESNQRLKM